jgi:uncharacterized protein (TIGR02594 family)
MQSEAVKKLQAMLNAVLTPSPRLKVDGVMGPKTAAALQDYQDARATLKMSAPPKLVVAQKVPASTGALAAGPSGTPWMSHALAENGVTEIVGETHNEKIVGYHATTSLAAKDDETPWCASFVNWVLKQAGVKGTGSAAAKSFITWGKRSEPTYGAIVVVKKIGAKSDQSTGSPSGYHVGFLVKKTATHVRILGGNQGGGTKVKESGYPLKNYTIEGIRMPTARGGNE